MISLQRFTSDRKREITLQTNENKLQMYFEPNVTELYSRPRRPTKGPAVCGLYSSIVVEHDITWDRLICIRYHYRFSFEEV